MRARGRMPAAGGRDRRVHLVTSALIGAETVVLVLLSVLVVGLLRSHAEILRRLERQSGAEQPSPTDSSAAGGRAHDLHGSTPSGGVRRVAMSPGSPSTLLAFLSTNCSSCAQLLESLEAGPPPLPAATRLVVVTGIHRSSARGAFLRSRTSPTS